MNCTHGHVRVTNKAPLPFLQGQQRQSQRGIIPLVLIINFWYTYQKCSFFVISIFVIKNLKKKYLKCALLLVTLQNLFKTFPCCKSIQIPRFWNRE